MSLTTMAVLGIALGRILVGAVFLIAGLAKLKASRGQFLSAILGYDLLSKPVAAVLARWLPWLEVVVGSLLIIGLGSGLAATLGMGLLLVFSSAVAVSLWRGKDQACGCFRALTPVQWRLVYRNLVMMGLLLPVYAFRGGAWAMDGWLNLWPAVYFAPSMGLTVLVVVWLLTLSATALLQWLTQAKSSGVHEVGLQPREVIY